MLQSRMQDWFLFLQCSTVPLPQLRGSVVGVLRKIEKDFIRLFSSADRVVGQDEFPQLGLIESRVCLNFRLCETRWFRICIRIEEWRRRRRIAGPKTEAAHFLRVGLACNLVRQVRHSAGMRWRWAARKACHCQIKTTPEKMHR